MSAAGIPQVAVVLGSCTAGGAYVPAMCDEAVIVAEPGHDLPRRPAAGEGGDGRGRDGRGAGRRRRPHAHLRRRRPPGATTTRDALRIAREIVAALPAPPPRRAGCSERPSRRRTIPAELYGIIAARPAPAVRRARGHRAAGRRPRFHEFKPRYGTTLVTGFAHLHGCPVGILANQGVLFSRVGAQGDALHRARLRSAASRCSSCRTSPASWSASATSTAASRRTAPRWCTRSRTPPCRSSR